MQTVWVELVFVVFSFFVVALAIAATIGYAARKGKPKSFDREMYWTTFVATGVVAGIISVYALRMPTDDVMWRHLLQLAILGLGAVLFGVSLGFGVGIFMRRHDSLPKTLD